MSMLFDRLKLRASINLHQLEAKTDAILSEGKADMAATARSRSVDSDIAASIHTVGPVTDKHGRRLVMVIAGDESTMIVSKDGKRYQRARMQEFGTRKTPALPYMRPAYRDVAPKVKIKLGLARRAFIKGLFSGQ